MELRRFKVKTIKGKQVRQMVAFNPDKRKPKARERRRKNRERELRAWEYNWEMKDVESTSRAFHVEFVPLLVNGIKPFIKPSSRPRVIDIGAGNAELSGKISERLPVRMRTVDAAAKEASGAKDPAVRARHIRAPAEKLPYPDGTFQVAMSVHTLIYTNRTKAVQEMKRVLKKGGGAVLIVHHPNSTIMRLADAMVAQSEGFMEYLRAAKAFCELGDDAPNTQRGRELAEKALAALGSNNCEAVKDRRHLFRLRIMREPAFRREFLEEGRIPEMIETEKGIVSAYKHLVQNRHKMFQSPEEATRFFSSNGFRVRKVEVVRQSRGIEVGNRFHSGKYKKGSPLGWFIVLEKK